MSEHERRELREEVAMHRRRWLLVAVLLLISIAFNIAGLLLRWLQPKPKSVAIVTYGGGGAGGSGKQYTIQSKLAGYSKEDVVRTRRLHELFTGKTIVQVNNCSTVMRVVNE